MSTADEQERAAFAARINELCDDKGLPSEHGRQMALARLFSVTGKAARKWLLGLGYPEMAMAVRIANWGEVNITWLLQGIGPKPVKPLPIDTKALVLNEAIRSLPPELASDLIDNIRAKLIRIGKLEGVAVGRNFSRMLDAYESEIASRKQ